MSDNLAQASEQTDTLPTASDNPVGRVGFVLSLTGVVGLFLVGPFGPVIGTVGMCLTFLCLPGLIVSIAGLFRPPKKLAKWGVALGIFGSLYLGTFYLAIFVFPYHQQ